MLVVELVLVLSPINMNVQHIAQKTNATNANLYVGSVFAYTQIIGGSTKSMTYGGDTNNDGAGKNSNW